MFDWTFEEGEPYEPTSEERARHARDERSAVRLRELACDIEDADPLVWRMTLAELQAAAVEANRALEQETDEDGRSDIGQRLHDLKLAIELREMGRDQ